MAIELRTSYWKKVNGEMEFIKYKNKLMNAMPEYFNDKNPEIMCFRIRDPMFDNSKTFPESGVTGMIVVTWVRTNVDWAQNKIEEIIGDLEDWIVMDWRLLRR